MILQVPFLVYPQMPANFRTEIIHNNNYLSKLLEIDACDVKESI